MEYEVFLYPFVLNKISWGNSFIGELKQIRISSLEYKKLCKALVGALIRF
jgi:hypothetical protein